MNPSVRFPIRAAAYTLMLFLSSIITTSILSSQTPTVTFTSHAYSSPATAASGVVGSAYSYDADATASDNSTVTYSLRYGPSGMAVNSSSGVVSWTPSSRGVILVEIRASLTSDPSISTTQGWAILVTQCGSNTIISGTVQDQNGNAVNSGTITARAVGKSNSPLASVSGSISNGAYSLVVDSGAYVLQATGGFTEQWYSGAYDLASATAVTASCGQSMTANFSVHVNPPFRFGTISGRVVSAIDNSPIAGRELRFYKLDRGVPEKLKWEKMQGDLIAMTNANGYYSTNNVNSGSNYMVALFSGTRSGEIGEMYQQFYDLAASPADATFLNLDSDHTDVNFLVYPDRGPYGQPIVLNVKDTAGNALVGGWQIAIHIIRDGEGNIQVDPMRSRCKGPWMDVDSGEYLLFAMPMDHHYAPGYYKRGGGTALDWHEATIINTDSLTATLVGAIYLSRVDSAGRSQLGGTITQSSSSTSKGGSQILGSAPLTNAMVFALDSSGRTSAWDYSDEKGNYTLDNLGSGEYTIIASKIGYTSVTQKASTSGLGEIIKADMNLQQNFTSSVPVVTGTSTHATSATAYPNPTNSTVTFGFDGAAGKAHISITSTSGTEVMMREVESTPGKNQTAVDVQSLASGTYIATITSGANVATVRFVIVR